MLWSISESNRLPAVRLLPQGTFLCRRRYTRKLRQRLAIASRLCTTRSAARRLVYGRLLLSSPAATLLRLTNVNLAPFDPHSGHRTDGGLRMMTQSAGSEVVGTLAPRCYEKIAKLLLAQTCLQRAGAMTPVRSILPLVAVEKSRNSPTAVGDRNGWPGCKRSSWRRKHDRSCRMER